MNNETWNELLAKIREKAVVAGDFAAKTAESAGKTATKLWSVSKSNFKVFELNTQIDVLYREIGKLAYQAHIGESVDESELEAHFLVVDEKRAEVEELRGEMGKRDLKVCPTCQAACMEGDKFCPNCGASLE